MLRYFILFILTTFWIVLLVARFTADVAVVATLWGFGACLLLAAFGWQRAHLIVSGAQVLRHLRTPQALWRTWLRTCMNATLWTWGVLVLAGTGLLMAQETPWPWSSAMALFSITLSLSTIAALSDAAVLHRAWAWCIAVGGLLLMLVLTMTIGLGAGLNWVAQAPFVLHLSLALSWPLLAYFLIRNWQINPPFAPTNTGGRAIGLGRWISNYARRYTILDARIAAANGEKPQHSFFSVIWIPVAGQMINLSSLAVPWQGEIYGYQLLGLAFFLPLLGISLACKDLHWRQLLAPGGLHHGRLGWPIFKTTVAIQLTTVLILGCAAVLFFWVAFNIPITRSLETVWRYRCVPAQWIFGVSLMSVVRSVSANHTGAIFAALFLVLLAIGGGMLWAFGLTKGHVLFLADSTFLFGLVFATAALVLLSNRLWTVKKLLPYLRLS